MSYKKLKEKRKLLEEEEATARVFQEYISTFQTPSKIPNKSFVKTAILAPGCSKETHVENQVYHLKPSLNSVPIKKVIECARICHPTNLETLKNKYRKPKTNLELFKEELKSLQLEREEQAKSQKMLLDNTMLANMVNNATTTNLYVSRFSIMTKNDLVAMFGPFGPLASVKIMWPKKHELVFGYRGFVAFMVRKDAERAFNYYQNSIDIKVNWAKPVELPSHPVYMPDEMIISRCLPSPATNLPFNAQPYIKNFHQPKNNKEMEDLLSKSIIKVVIPLDKLVLQTINRMVEFVVHEGPSFEAIIMNREIHNPDYQFLFDNKSQEHIYYRWRLFSVLNGDDLYEWRTEPFRMFENGAIWLPPEQQNFKDRMPNHLISMDKESIELTDDQHKLLINILRDLSISRASIAKVMVFCIENVNAIVDVIDVIVDSLKNMETNPLKKLARLFLLSDLLHNMTLMNIPLEFFETRYKDDLLRIFESLNSSFTNFKYPFDKHNFELRVKKTLLQWRTVRFVSDDLIKKLEETFTYEVNDGVKENEKNSINLYHNEIMRSKWDTDDDSD